MPSDSTSDTPESTALVYALLKDPHYPWCLDSRSTQLPQFLGLVYDGIVAAARALLLTIQPSDLLWLRRTRGQYHYYLPPGLRRVQDRLACKRFKKHPFDGMELRIKAHLLETEFTSIEVSPRFRGLNSANTQRNYEQFMRQFWWFLAMIGDYSSMLLLLPHPPAMGEPGHGTWPSIELNSMELFVQHKCQKPSKLPLTQSGGTGAVFDVHGNNVLGQGTINNPGWMESFYAAVSHIHHMNGQGGTYLNRCADCCDIFQKFLAGDGDVYLHRPCPQHSIQHRISRGNPSLSKFSTTQKKKILKDSKARDYHVKKRSALFPSDLEDISNRLSSSQYPLHDLVCFTMLLNAIEGGMRFDGYEHATVADFERYSGNWLLKTNSIGHLAQGVKEKNDTQWSVYQVSWKDSFPKACFLRHLLVMVHCVGVRSGHLYPSKEGLHDSQLSVAGISKSGMGYSCWTRWFKNMLATACRHSHLGNWGAHTPRRTFYLFGVLGGGLFEPLMRNARHVCERTAKSYYEDACVTRDFIKSEPEVAAEQTIWPFRDKLMANNGLTNKRIHNFCSDRVDGRSLADVAQSFVETQLGVGPNHRYYKNPGHLLKISFKKSFSGTNPLTDFQVMADMLPHHMRDPIKASFHAALIYRASVEATRIRKEFDDASRLMASTSAATQSVPPPSDVLPSSRPPAQLCRFVIPVVDSCDGTFVYTFHADFANDKRKAKQSPRQTSLLLFQVVNEVLLVHPGTEEDASIRFVGGRKLLRKRKEVFSRYLNHFFACLHGCHDMDVAKFIHCNPQYSPEAYKSAGGCAGCRSRG